MTGMPWAWALSITWAPAPFRSTRSITLQPLVSCWSARVAYLPVSFRAFWMSVSKPIALNCDSRAGRSPFSQRLDESASGSMMQARFAAAADEPDAELPLPESSLPQAASESIPAAARNTAVAVFLVVIRELHLRTGGKATKDGRPRCRWPQATSARSRTVKGCDHIVVHVHIVSERPRSTRDQEHR